jgi:uncharacterized membrane protein (DUF373 family)
MLEWLQKFERAIYLILIALLIIVVIFSVIELAYIMFAGIWLESKFQLENFELLDLLGYFLLVLIVVELLDTIKVYIEKNEIHVEVIVLLAIIAVARKVIILDPAKLDFILLVGLGVLFISLAGGYYLIKRAGNPFKDWGVS